LQCRRRTAPTATATQPCPGVEATTELTVESTVDISDLIIPELAIETVTADSPVAAKPRATDWRGNN